jgi:outer membrane PBP1 activator LpoA protein
MLKFMYLRILKTISGVFVGLFALGLAGCVSTGAGFGGSALAGKPPTKVALLVPLQGAAGRSGDAIRNGFLTAYYYAKEQQADAPAVDVVDTSKGDIVALYQQAVANGADFVVGPLTKENLRALVGQGKLSVPTLALNTLDDGSRVTNLYQFGLSPQDEAEQVAVRARQDGHGRALVIAPAGVWGQGIAAAFAKRWQALGGTVVDSYTYLAKGDYSAGVRRLLQVDAPPRRSVPGVRYMPKPRHDADVIFLVAFPQQARQIKPALMFYNATMPVYATSLIYTGMPSATYDQDLNGIEFGDIPWLLGPGLPQWNEMRARIEGLWASSYRASPRLYALGIDAYHLTYGLQRLTGSTAILQGATGMLSVDSNLYIRRQIEWATMQNGMPQPLR